MLCFFFFLVGLLGSLVDEQEKSMSTDSPKKPRVRAVS